MVFRDEYYFLSNMYPCTVTMSMNGKTYTFPCSESAFQAAKCPPQAYLFATGPKNKYPDGFKAKKGGRNVPLRPDWEQIKLHVMAEALHAKFSNPQLEAKLVSITGPIVEENTWHDTYWGCCAGEGANYLGRLLMEIRKNPPSKGFKPDDWLAAL